ncbi:MAG: glycerophosphoryl diester phosphodiesterase membrane domain-containing protein [Caldilineaceae bacterium]|nr:glycerophosphoryl diester phosphodiesterase membrane domain-containing protein [Caldilineaceae bacterium]
MSASAPVSTSGPAAISGPLTIADLLDRTFRALRARFGVLMLSAAIVMVPVGVVTALLTGRFLTGYFDLLEFTLATPESADLVFEEFFGDFLGYFGAILLLSLFSILGSTVVNLMTIYHIDRFLHGETSTVGDGLRVALRRLLPMIGMQIVQFLIIGLVTAVVLIAIGLIFFAIALLFGGLFSMLDSGNDVPSVLLIIGIVLVVLVGYVLMIVLMLAPAAFYMARWLAAGPSLLIERLGPIQSLRRSWELTRGRLWRGVLYVVLLAIFSGLVISLPLIVTQQIAIIAFPTQLALITIISTMAGYLLNLFYQPFYATGVVMYYYDLRVRAEAYDVTLRVAALEAELTPDAPPA